MTKRRLVSYLAALAGGRRPDSFDAVPEDADVLRTAIALRSARPGDSLPDDGFVDRLYEELADGANPQVIPITRRSRRRTRAAVAIAAGLGLLGGAARTTDIHM